MKYIVYKTTNLVNGFIYIGVHKTRNPEKFDGYLGCGVYINKPNTYEKAKTCFQNAVKQYGIKNFQREIISIFDTAEEAYLLEELIVNEDFLSRNDVYNMILGGNINYPYGKKVYMYEWNTGTFLKEFDSLQEASDFIQCDSSTISHSIKFKFRIKEYCFSYLKKTKLDLTEFNFKVPIIVYRYTKEGIYDKEYSSLNEAGKDTFNTSAVYIQKAATLGYLVKDTYYFSFYKENQYDKARTVQIKNRLVYKYDTTGKFIKQYNTQSEAELENKYCNITKSIKLRCKDEQGNYWSLVKLKEFNIPKHNIPKKVAKLDSNDNIIKTWNSSNQCAKEEGTAVKNVLQGKYMYHKGFKYIYMD